MASLDDGSDEVEVELGTYEVEHPDGTVAPSVRFLVALEDALFTDADVQVPLEIEITGPEPVDAVLVTVEAVLGDTVVELIEDPWAGNPFLATLTVADLPAGDRWRLRVTVETDTATRVVESPAFAVGRGTSDLGWADVEPIFARSCVPCHGEISRAPGTGFDLRILGRGDDEFGVYDYRGLIYRRAVLERTMPPQSAALLIGDHALLSPEDRATLREWLLAGALP